MFNVKNLSAKDKKIIVLVVIALVSALVLSWFCSSPTFNAGMVKALDDKKISVTSFTTVSSALAIAVAAIPSDATTPIANQIMEITGYLFLVVCMIVIEKLIATMTGYITFGVLVPAACVLYIVYLYKEHEGCKELSRKLAAFGIALLLMVPTSLWASQLVDHVLDMSVEQSIQLTERESEEIKSGAGIASMISSKVDELKNKARNALSNCIDTVAVIMVNNLVIPIAVFYIYIWLLKTIFGLKIDTRRIGGFVKGKIKSGSKKAVAQVNTVSKQVIKEIEEKE